MGSILLSFLWDGDWAPVVSSGNFFPNSPQLPEIQHIHKTFVLHFSLLVFVKNFPAQFFWDEIPPNFSIFFLILEVFLQFIHRLKTSIKFFSPLLACICLHFLGITNFLVIFVCWLLLSCTAEIGAVFVLGNRFPDDQIRHIVTL